jgi:Tol biopolymer transport system component
MKRSLIITRYLFLVWVATVLVFVLPIGKSVAASSVELAAPQVCIVYSKLTGKWVPGKDSSGRYDLFLSCTGSTKPRQLTNRSNGLGSVVWYPRFSPNGKSILFVANKTDSKTEIDLLESPTYRMQGTNLWTLSIDSKGVKPLTTDGSGYRLFSWAPDGKWVAAVQYGWPPYDQIMVWDLKSNKRRLLSKRSKQETLTDLFWSQDSTKLYFQRNTSTASDPNLYVIVRSDGKAKVQVKGKGERHYYSFSSDNRKLAFVQNNVLYVSNADGSGLQQLMKLADSAGVSRPSWSLKGQIAISETIEGKTQLHVCDVTSKHSRKVASVPYNVTETRWSRDNQWLLLKLMQAGSTDAPDPITGWYMYRREGLLAVSTIGDRQLLLKEPNEETKGLDWFETVK